MKYTELISFINASLEKWEKIKKDFSNDKEMSAFLKKAYAVVMLDYHQLDISLARELYKKPKAAKEFEDIIKRELRLREEFRLRMAEYFEKELKVVSLDVRFQYLNIELIQMLKSHPDIKEVNDPSPASIRVVIAQLVNQ